jgi:hypothetical protein
MRRKGTLIIALLSMPLVVSACGGGGGGGGILPHVAATPCGCPTTTIPQGSPQPIPTPGSLLAAQGTVASHTSSSMTLATTTGSVPVSTSSSTTIIGGSVTNGDYAQVAGTGSLSAISAVEVTLWKSAPSSITVSGAIASAAAYGFTLDVDASHTAVPVVVTTGTTIAGGQLATNERATVTGTGATNEAILATQVTISTPSPTPAPSPTPSATPAPTPTPAAPPAPIAHIATVIYDSRTLTATSTQIAPYVSWDYANAAGSGAPTSPSGRLNANNAAGVQNVGYTNIFNPLCGPSGQDLGCALLAPGGAYASAEARNCAGNVVTWSYGAYTGYVLDVNSPQAAAYVSAALALYAHYPDPTSPDPWNVLFLDNYNVVASAQYGASGVPCDYTSASAWTSAVNAIMSQETQNRYVGNTLGVDGEGNVTPAMLENQVNGLSTAGFIGGEFEHCYVGIPVPSEVTYDDNAGHNAWTDNENMEIATIASNHQFWCQANGAWGTGWAANQTAGRIYVDASLLLTADPTDQLVALAEEMTTADGFTVYPESGFVATAPVTTQSAVSGYQDGYGVYTRAFGECYYRNEPLGPCRISVNPSQSVTRTYAYAAQYPFVMALSGSDTLDADAWIGFNAPSPSTIAPATAIIAVQQPATPMGTTVPPPISQ